MNPTALLIGTLAGLASALLFAGLATQSPGAVVLALAAPIPVMIASLGWGSVAGFIAAIAGFGAIAGALGSAAAGLSFLLSLGLPSAAIGHVAGLARLADTQVQVSSAPVLDWYPLPRILFVITLLAVASCLAIGWLIGYDAEELAPAVAEALTSEAAGSASPDQIQDLARLVVGAIPFVQPAFLVLTSVLCLYVSAAVVRLSGRLPRPKDDVPAQANLPRLALGVFAFALAVSFFSGMVATIGAVVAGALACAFTLVGLAALHRRTRGRAARGLLLFTAYAAIVLLSIPLLAFMVLGVFETAKSPARPASSNPNP